MKKLLTFFSKNISIYAIFNDQIFNNKLTNDIVSFEQLGPDFQLALNKVLNHDKLCCCFLLFVCCCFLLFFCLTIIQ